MRLTSTGNCEMWAGNETMYDLGTTLHGGLGMRLHGGIGMRLMVVLE